MDYKDWVELAGQAIDLLGVAVIVVGTVFIMVRFVIDRIKHRSGPESYRLARLQLGKSILLGLELLVAGDIIRTVATTPTFSSVGVLAAIVGVRTFLSFTMIVELDGRWPWQKKDPKPRMLPQVDG